MKTEIEGMPIEVQYDNDEQDTQLSVMGRKNQPSTNHYRQSGYAGGGTAQHVPENKLPKGIRPEVHSGALVGPMGDRVGTKETIVDDEKNSIPVKVEVIGKDSGPHTL